METAIKCSVTAILGAALCLLIKKDKPELSLAFSALLSASILIAAFEIFSYLAELTDCAKQILGESALFFSPLLKCLAIGFICRFGSDICKDASQTALASAVELTGTLCAAATAIPLVISTIKMIGTMV